jgi:tRNA(Arg) A34 adenosine deaminase TadA
LGYHNKGDKVMIYAQLPEAGAAILKNAAVLSRGTNNQEQKRRIMDHASLTVMRMYPEYFQPDAIEYAENPQAFIERMKRERGLL